MPNDCIALPQAYNPHNHRSHGGSVQRGLSAAIAAAAGFNVCAAADKRYSLSVTRAGAGVGTVTSAPAVISCGATCSASYRSQTAVTLTATPAPGSTFAGWSGACTGTGTCTVTMDTEKSVTATFNAPIYALSVTKSGTGIGTVTSAPAGIPCGTDCLEIYTASTSITLTATPAPGSTFAGWSGACTGTGTCTVTMDAAKNLTATFNIAPFVAATSAVITATSATITTAITFNAPDVGKSGAVYVTAWVPVGALGTLGISVAANSLQSITGTRDNPNLAGAVNSLQVTQETPAATDPAVLIQLTPSSWQLVVNGQLVPYASGVLGNPLGAQTILQNADTTNLRGAQFCLGYGASANDMIAAGNVQLIATIPDPNSTSTATGSCLLTTLPVHRFADTQAGGHFYTIHESEKNAALQNYSWFKYEGIGFYAATVPQPGMLPVHRLADTRAGGHFYTIYESEKNDVLRNYDWFKYEGIGFYASQIPLPGMLPVYRFADTRAGGHFHTIHESEKNAVIQNYNWFRYEGIGFYAYPTQ